MAQFGFPDNWNTRHESKLTGIALPDGAKFYSTISHGYLEIDLNKLNALGFTGIWGEPLHNGSGNGGVFSIFVKGHNELLTPIVDTTPASIPYLSKEARHHIRMVKADRANARITKRNGPMYY